MIKKNKIKSILLSLLISMISIKATYANQNIVPNIILDIKNTTVEEALKGSSIRHFYHIENNSNITLESLSLTIPIANGLSIERLFTGQFNKVMNYKIYYKTNLKKDLGFLSSAITNLNEEIDLSIIKLEKNEHISEICFEFKNIEVGFKEIESPFIFTKVISDNDDLINKYYATGEVKKIVKQKESSFITRTVNF